MFIRSKRGTRREDASRPTLFPEIVIVRRIMVCLSAGRLAWVALLAIVALPLSSRAEVITFDFNSLSDGASNSAIQTYFNSVWSGAGQTGAITVTGARGERNYTGDNFVVGPVSGNTVTSLTLGNSDGGVPRLGSLDTFLITGTHSSGADRIVLTFPKPVYQISFDYEIFPNGDGRTPDFSFIADGDTMFVTIAQAPQLGDLYTNSPVSGPMAIEKNPQFLGLSGTWFFPEGVTKLEFVDWPEMVGIDNLKVDTAQVPEPATALVFAGAFGGLVLARRLRRARK